MLAAIVAADGQVTEKEVQTGVEAYQRATGQQLDPVAFRAEATRYIDQGSLHDILLPLVKLVPHEHRAQVFRAAFEVARADGSVAPEENALLDTVAVAMRMTMSEYRQVLVSLVGS